MRKFVLIMAAATMLAGLALTAAAEEFSYVGVKKCSMCHKKEESGAQFTQWSNSDHAKAFTVLASEESKALAKKMGIDDPQKSDKCLKCHVTGHGKGELAAAILPENGVGCESCHGAGSGYYKKADMTAIYKGEVDGAKLGLTKITEATCTVCHNAESPTFKGFKYQEALKAVAHPIPKSE